GRHHLRQHGRTGVQRRRERRPGPRPARHDAAPAGRGPSAADLPLPGARFPLDRRAWECGSRHFGLIDSSVRARDRAQTDESAGGSAQTRPSRLCYDKAPSVRRNRIGTQGGEIMTRKRRWTLLSVLAVSQLGIVFWYQGLWTGSAEANTSEQN